jgi:hypothetical protein
MEHEISHEFYYFSNVKSHNRGQVLDTLGDVEFAIFSSSLPSEKKRVGPTPRERTAAEAIDESALNARLEAIRAKRARGESLSAEDMRMVQLQVGRRNQVSNSEGPNQLSQNPPPTPETAIQRVDEATLPLPGEHTGLVPLTDLGTGTYKGESGGLYGEDSNEPPASHRTQVEKVLALVVPRDGNGVPSRDGKIALLSVGMSNTTMEFQTFMKMAESDPLKSPEVVFVDGAQGGRVASVWARGTAGIPPEIKLSEEAARKVDPWPVVDQRLQQAGVTPQQVQVAWIKHAQARPASQGEFPKHAQLLAENIILTLQRLRERFPNLQVAYLSSRIYAGYATTDLNPEPYAYEGGFAVRWVIQKQIAGDPGLNFEPEKGAVQAPAVLWGPYLWTDGIRPRHTDNLIWLKDDVVASDRTHPSNSGREKVANLLLNFLHQNPLASSWYLRKSQ